jgi:acyl-CoA synthetase (AMP-forming)/AMP-acid ligase II
VNYSHLNPGDWVTAHARYAPDAPCLVRGNGEVITYREANRLTTRLAHAFREAGIGRGDRVAILATDSPEYVCVLLACMKLGATFVALNYRLAGPEIGNLLRTSEPKALLLSRRYAEVVAAGLAAIRSDLLVLASFDEVDGVELTLDQLVAGASGSAEIESPAEEEDILSLALTSGTTGTPKGVLQSQRMMRASTICGAMELGLKPDDIIYSGAPLFHISGIGHLLYGLSRGAASLVLTQFDADEVLSWLQSGRLQHAMLIPSMVISLLGRPTVRDCDYPRLRSIMYGGAPMAPSVIRDMAEVFGCDLYNGFGAGTEASGQAMFRPADHRRALAGEEHLLGSIGKPIWGCDIKLCDPDGNEVPSGEVGEIWSRSESVMSGYLGQPELTAASLRDGWFRAGDLAWRDKDGYLFLAGRADDMIIRGGENVYPVEIEDVLADLPAVCEVAVVGEPDPYWGEVVTAVVSLDVGASLSYEELVAHCNSRLARYKVPHRLVIAPELPKNPTGKIRKGMLRQALANGDLA